MDLGIRVDRVDVQAEAIGDHHLPEQPPADELETGGRARPVRARPVDEPLGLELRQEIGRALDRPGHELRKERYVEREPTQVALDRDLPAVEVDRVAERLERVERDPDREQQIEWSDVDVEAQASEQATGTRGRESSST